MDRQLCLGVLFIALAGCHPEPVKEPVLVTDASDANGAYVFGIEGAPEQYQGDTQGGVIFAPPEVVNQICGSALKSPPPEGVVILACTNPANKMMLLPNPCPYQDIDPYARLLCHEAGHINGWVHEA